MTKKEKQLIDKAIQLLQSDDGYADAISILCHLVGKTWIYDRLSNKSKNISELPKKDTKFKINKQKGVSHGRISNTV
jgi:hypothetical protein